MKSILLFILFLSVQPSLLAQTQEYSHGEPTNDEQYMLELVNRARAYPAEEGVLIMDTEDEAVQQSLSYWQINKSATKQAFTTYPQRPPLVFHPSLITAARKHTADMIANNFQGHTGSDGSSLGVRFSREGYASMGMYGENVSAYSNSVWYGHCGLLTDWGTQNQIDLGHRRNLLNFDSQVFTEIGIGITYSGGGLQQGTVGPYVITQDFGVRNIVYITGVAYNDINKNGSYDPGEGLGDVRIQPSRGTYHAITSASGGFAIPFSGGGSVTLTASGGSLTANMVKTIDFSGENIKVDFAPSAQLPGSVTLVVPANNATKVVRTEIAFDWNTSQFANAYEIQVASASTFAASAIVFTQTGATTDASASVPKCATKYYWRVRAVNDAGNGTWSSTFAFTTDGKNPTSPNLVGPRGQTSVDFDKSLTCTWQPVTDATRYHIRFSTYISLSQPFYEDSTLTQTTFDLPASQIPTNGSFYWSVRSVNDCGGSNYANAAQVTATVTDVEERKELPELSISIAPMPVTSISNIVVSSDKDCLATMSVIDNIGRATATWQQSLHAGMNQLNTDVFNALTIGSYTFVVDDGQRVARKMFLH